MGCTFKAELDRPNGLRRDPFDVEVPIAAEHDGYHLTEQKNDLKRPNLRQSACGFFQVVRMILSIMIG